MSFWDKVGDAWNAIKGTTATVGGAISTANNFAVNDIPVLGQAIGGTESLLGEGAGAINTVYSYGIARPASTMLQMMGHDGPGTYSGVTSLRSFVDADAWRKAWNQSAEITPGQALVIDSGHTPTPVNFDSSPDAINARNNFFHNTWQGQISSGAADIGISLLADPTLLATKGAKAAELSRISFKNEDETARVLDVNAGERAAESGREANMSARTDKFFKSLDGKTSAQIMLNPVVKQSKSSGAFAYLLGQVNERYAADAVARRTAQRNVFGAMLGNDKSIQALKDQHSLLANDLYRMSDTPATSKAAADFSWEDSGKGVMQAANAADAPEVIAQRTAIEHEMARLEAAISSTGTVGRVAGTLPERAKSALQANNLKESFLNSGIGNRPIRVIAGAIANRLPGQIAIKDPVQGYTDLENTLRQASSLDPSVRRGLLDNYVNAGTNGERQNAVQSAEAAVLHSTADKYGLTPTVAQQILEAGNSRRAAVLGSLQSRLYSASDDAKFVTHVDPEEDVVTAYSRPVLQSQLEDSLPFINPVELDKALKAAVGNRLMERVAGTIGNATVDPMGAASRQLAGSALDKLGSARMIASDALTATTRLWKDSALMRLAYPMRIQTDSQMRLMTHMGVLSYLASVPAIIKAQKTYLKTEDGVIGSSWRNVFKGGDYKAALTDMLRGAEIHEDDIPGIIDSLASSSGSMADLAGEMSNAQLARFRATGQWGFVDPEDVNWKSAWTRAVNRQIRNSPTAMKAAEGASTSELRQFIRTDPAGRREWLDMSATHGADVNGWLQRVQAHVDHYLPTAEQKSAVLDGKVSGDQIEQWFGDVGNRMRVHGEGYSATTKSALADWYERKRNGWYKFASDAPETVMARAPLYVHAFKRNLKDIVDRHGLDSSDYSAIDGDLMTQYRKSASDMARREVGRILYDTSHASNLSQTFRYVSPFFGAWEDMIKKWGGLFYDHPGAAVRFDQAWNAPNNAGFVIDENGNRVDAEGNHYDPNTGRKLDPVKDKYLIGKRQLVTVPSSILPKSMQDSLGIGDLDPATGKKRPGSLFSIDKNSFNIVFQGDPWWLPGSGPIVQVPVNELVKNSFPEAADNPVISAILPHGVSDNSVEDQFLPSWIRQARNAFGNTQDYANVQAMLLAQETARVQNGERGPIKPGEIANMSRNWFVLRAITANASPVSMTPTPKAQFYVDQAHIYRQKYGQNWQEQFYKDFPQWYDMSLSLSDNETGIVASLNAQNTASTPAIRKLIADNPEYGWAAVGPDNTYGQTAGTAFNQAAYAWEEQPIGYGQSKGFRGKSSPQDALAKVEASKGWVQYQSVMTKLNLVLEQRGLHSFTQKGAEDLEGIKKKYTDWLASSNDSWRKDFLATDSGKVVNFLDWAKQAQASTPALAKRADFKALTTYTQIRGYIQQVLASRAKHSLDDPMNADVKQAWDGVNAYLRQNNIGFEQSWNRILQHDDPSKELIGDGG